MKYSLFLILCCLLYLSLGCGGSEHPVADPSTDGNTDTMNGTADYSLNIADTVSQDLQADFNIYTVDDISASSSGYIALLDGSRATVTVIDSSGTFVSAGGLGNGPGEYQQPKAVSVSEDGSVAVSDFMGGIVRILEPALDSYVDIEGFIMANPGKMILLNSGGIAGMRIMFTSEDGETAIGHQTALWAGTGSEPSTMYSENMHTFSLNDFGWSLIAPYPMTCRADGVVYTAAVSTERYVLNSIAPDGTFRWSVERPFERTEKTQEEIDIEKDIVTRLMQQSEHQADYTPETYNYAVTDLALGPNGNLWARRPGTEKTFFDVYEVSEGDYLFSVSSDYDYELLEVTPGGILAVLPGESQSLVLMDMEQNPPTSN